MRKLIVIICCFVVASAWPSRARAEQDGFGEVVLGLAMPIGGSEGDAGLEYDDTVDPSFKLGLRGGTRAPGKVGFELAVDWTPFDDELDSQLLDVSVHRFRVQGGARFGAKVQRKVMIFGRFLGGLDLVRVAAEGELFGISYEADELDVGLALELGGGVLVDAGGVALGVSLSMPIAFHFDDDDPDDAEDFDLDYSAFDLDLLFTLGSSF